MSYALSSGVTGLQAHQEMLDVAGNNLANVNTTAFKASRVGFAELLSQTIEQASQPTGPRRRHQPPADGQRRQRRRASRRTWSRAASSTRAIPWTWPSRAKATSSSATATARCTRAAGAFGVDANGDLVDPATGYRVQRIGLTGESDGFQIPGDSNIRIPYGIALAGQGDLRGHAHRQPQLRRRRDPAGRRCCRRA